MAWKLPIAPEKLRGLEKAQWERALEATGDEKKAWEAWDRWKCKTDLWYLATEVYGWDRIRRRTGKNGMLLDSVFHRWMFRALEPRDSMLMMVPRGHLKTSALNLRIAQEILVNPYVRIGLLSLTTKRARQSMGTVTKLLADSRLRQRFPEIPPPGKNYRGWEIANQDELTVYRPPRPEGIPDEPQLSVYGVESTNTGLHFDWWIGDDILDDSTVRSQLLLDKTEDWYRHASGKLDPMGWETYLGTHYHHMDLWTQIRKEQALPRIYVRGAVENGRPIYRFFTLEMLEKIRKRMGDYIFNCQYYNNPIPTKDMLFPPPQPTFETLPETEYVFYMAVDPAATTKVYSDETAIVVAAVDKTGCVWVMEALHFKKSGDQIAEAILQLNEKYHPKRIGIELGLQEHLMVILRMAHEAREKALQQRIELPVTSIKIDRTKGKYDRFNITVGAFLRSGKLKIHTDLHALMNQMGTITVNYKGKDDIVDALSMIFPLVGNFSYGRWKNTSLTNVGWAAMEDIFRPKGLSAWAERFAVN